MARYTPRNLNASHAGKLDGEGDGGGGESIATVRAVLQMCFLLKCHSRESEGDPSLTMARRYIHHPAQLYSADIHLHKHHYGDI